MSLNCRQVHGLDATSAQTFGTLWTMLERLGVELVITHLDNPEMERLLRAHGVIDDTHCACATLSHCSLIAPAVLLKRCMD